MLSVNIVAIGRALHADYQAVPQLISHELNVTLAAKKIMLKNKSCLKKVDWSNFTSWWKCSLWKSFLKVTKNSFCFAILTFSWFVLSRFIPVQKVERKVAGTEKCDWKAPELPPLERSWRISLKKGFFMCSRSGTHKYERCKTSLDYTKGWVERSQWQSCDQRNA